MQLLDKTAILDMDIYEPTKAALENILPYLTKGSIIGFDEMNWDICPGPTRALDEVIGLRNCRIERSPLQPIPGYMGSAQLSVTCTYRADSGPAAPRGNRTECSPGRFELNPGGPRAPFGGNLTQF